MRCALSGEALLRPDVVDRLHKVREFDGPSIRRRLVDFDTLTRREAAVLRHLTCGLTVEDIAVIDRIGVATVRSHVRSTLKKLGVASQVAAVALAYRTGWAFRE